VIEALTRLPAGQRFENTQDVWAALGHSEQTRS
jgi:hypothetical protein